MGRTGWRLTEDELRRWLDDLLGTGVDVIAPVDREGLMLFRPLTSGAEASFGAGKPRWSPKEFLFPRTETLYTYELRANGPRLEDPPLADRERILFGVPSCDAVGLTRLDAVFIDGEQTDPFYARRRSLCTVVSVACDEAGPECFCTAVGGSPAGTEGVDLQIHPLGGTWLVAPLTEKGQALVTGREATWTPAAGEDWNAAERQTRRVAREMNRAPLTGESRASLERAFDDPMWRDVARRCMSCSICAYVCPSCSCFDVHHEGNTWRGRELRCWDACTFAQFTAHASGHNPRGGPEARYRQRLLHKFAYVTEGQEGLIRCVGCGRCTALCPAGIDFHETVRGAIERLKGSDDERR